MKNPTSDIYTLRFSEQQKEVKTMTACIALVLTFLLIFQTSSGIHVYN